MGTIINTIGILLTSLGIWLGYWTYLKSKRLEIFRTYTEKYNSIICSEVLADWQNALDGDKEMAEKLENKMVEYLNLVWEEHHLYEERLIPRNLWELWRPEIRRVLSSDFAQTIITKYEFHFTENLDI